MSNKIIDIINILSNILKLESSEMYFFKFISIFWSYTNRLVVELAVDV